MGVKKSNTMMDPIFGPPSSLNITSQLQIIKNIKIPAIPALLCGQMLKVKGYWSKINHTKSEI